MGFLQQYNQSKGIQSPVASSSGSTGGGFLRQYQAKEQANPTATQSATPTPKITQAPKIQAKPVPKQSSFLDKFVSFFNNIPGVTAQHVQPLIRPVPDKQVLPQATNRPIARALNFGTDLAAGTINTPREAGKGAVDLYQNHKTNSLQQNAGDIASIVQLPLLFLGGGSAVKTGVQALKQTGKKALVEVGKAISKDVIVGGAFGALSGVQSGRDIKNVKDYLNNLWDNVKVGGEIGGGAGVAVHGLHATVKDVALPLAKGASSKLGAVFVKNVNTNPEVAHIQLDPEVARNAVVGNDELSGTPVGKAVIKESVVAEQTGEHVAITPTKDGAYTLPDGQKVDVSTAPIYEPKPQENTQAITDEKPKEGVISKSFDAQGKEIVPKGNKKILTGNEVKAIRTTIDAKLEHLRNNAGNPNDYAKGIDDLVTEVKDKSQGDKVVLSALRTELNKEMYGFAGASGNYKEAYATLQSVKKADPELGGVIDKFEDHIKNLDETLIKTPDNTHQVPAFVKERQKEQKGMSGAQEPVGQGKTKESSAYKHRLEHLAETDPQHYEYLQDKNGKVTYNVNKAKEDMEKAADLLQKDPQKAYNVAMGREKTPEGQTTNAVAIAVSDRAEKEGNWDVVSSVETTMSLRSTRGGQENAALRGRFNDDSPHSYIQTLINTRLKNLGGSLLSSVKDEFPGQKVSRRKAAIAQIDKEKVKLKNILTKEQRKVKVAQSIIDELTCK